MLHKSCCTTTGQISLPAGRSVFRYFAFGSDVWMLILAASMRVKSKPSQLLDHESHTEPPSLRRLLSC